MLGILHLALGGVRNAVCHLAQRRASCRRRLDAYVFHAVHEHKPLDSLFLELAQEHAQPGGFGATCPDRTAAGSVSLIAQPVVAPADAPITRCSTGTFGEKRACKQAGT